jgi:hypothetical protein
VTTFGRRSVLVFFAASCAAAVLLVLSRSERFLWESVARPSGVVVDPLRSRTWARPDEAGGPRYRFSRWDALIEINQPGLRIAARSDDGVRVWVDGRIAIDNWTVHAPTVDMSDGDVAPGPRLVRVQHFNDTGPAALSVYFVSPDGVPVYPGRPYLAHRREGEWVKGGFRGLTYSYDPRFLVRAVSWGFRVAACGFAAAALLAVRGVVASLRRRLLVRPRPSELDSWVTPGTQSPAAPLRPRVRIGIYGAFTVAALAATWPLIGHLPTKIAKDMGDPLLNAWVIAWNQHCFLRLSPDVFDANIFYPLPAASAFTDYQWATALLSLPIRAVTANPILIYNCCVLLAFILAAVGFFELARWLTRDTPASVAGAFLVTFTPYRFAQLSHLQVASSHFVPVVLLLTHLSVIRRKGWAIPLLLGAALVAQYLTGFYHAAFLSLYLPVFAGLLLVRYRRMIDVRRAFLRLCLSAGLAVLLVTPFLLNSLRVLPHLPEDLERRSPELFRPVWAMLSRVHVGNQTWARVLPSDAAGPTCLFPGLTLAVLGLVGLSARRFGTRVAYGVLIFLPLLMASGGAFALASEVYPLFRVIRAPSRQAMLSYTALAVAAVYGLRRIGGVLGRRGRWLLAGGVSCLALVESWNVPLPLNVGEVAESSWPGHHLAMGERAPGVYRWLANADRVNVIAEVPDRRLERFIYQLYSVCHWKRSVGGVSGQSPPISVLAMTALHAFPSEASLRAMASLGVDRIVVHYGIIGTGAPALWDKVARARGMLSPEYTEGGDVVYRLTVDSTYERLVQQAEVIPLPAPVVTAGDSLVTEVVDGKLGTAWRIPVAGSQPSALHFVLSPPAVLRGVRIAVGPDYLDYPRMAIIRARHPLGQWKTLATESDLFPWLPDMLAGPDRGSVYVFFEPTPVAELDVRLPRWPHEGVRRVAEIRGIAGG